MYLNHRCFQRTLLYLLLLLVPLYASAQDAQISDGYQFDGEPFIAVNPTNTSHVVIAWMGFDGLDLIQIKVRVSNDGGMTWQPEVAIPHINPGYTHADPSMDWDSDGNLYLCYIDYHPFGTGGKTLIRRSTDGGFTWDPPVEVIDAWADGFELPIDRPWLAIDRSGGALNGYQYVTTKPAPWIPFPNRNYLIVSPDGVTFNAWRYIDTIGWRIGSFIQAPMAVPAVGNDGLLHLVYPAWELTENLLPRMIHASSNNGGASFTYHEMIESYGDELNSDTSAKAGYQLLVNPSNPDHLAFLWVYRPHGDNDIYLLESFDAGANWNAPVRVNNDAIGNGVLQDLVWGDFNSAGDLAVSWRDRREALPDTGYAVRSGIRTAVKWSGNATFDADFPLSYGTAAFDSVLFESGNDFMSLQFEGDTIYATWGDTRDELLKIWFSRQSASDPGTGISQPIALETISSIPVYPNPATKNVVIGGGPFDHLRISDMSGKILQTYTVPGEWFYLDISTIARGTYLIEAWRESTSFHAKMFVE